MKQSSFWGEDRYTKPVHKYPKLDNKIKIDWSLFTTLLEFQTPSSSRAQMLFADQMTQLLIAEGCTVSRDNHGNVYAVKGKADIYPCAVAHMDINQDDQVVTIVKTDLWCIGIDTETGLQAGPGFDDKCGVYFCLEMVRQLDVVKIALFVDEEIGCIGSSNCDDSFFYDCSMILQLDRNGYAGPEFCYYSNGVQMCGKDFVYAAYSEFEKYEYVPAKGVYTDVGTLKKFRGIKAIAANIGCGYFDEHTSKEILLIQAFENAVNFAYELMLNLGNMPWTYEEESVSYSVGNSRFGVDRYTQEEFMELEVEEIRAPAWVNGEHYICRGGDVHYEDAQEMLDDGYCPGCYDDRITEDLDHLIYCGSCNSYWNIPVNARVV